MKKIVLIAGICMVSMQLFAQDTVKAKTLINNKTFHSGYIALSGIYTQFNNENAVLVGGHGGWLINHRVMIGLAGYGTVTRHAGFGTNAQNTQNRLRMGYGGLMVEYTFAPAKLVHITASALVGAGAVSNGYKKDYHYGDNGEQWRSVGASAFFVAEPALHVEMNLSENVRVDAGGGYRYIKGSKLDGIADDNLRAFTASLSFKFGIF